LPFIRIAFARVFIGCHREHGETCDQKSAHNKSFQHWESPGMSCLAVIGTDQSTRSHAQNQLKASELVRNFQQMNKSDQIWELQESARLIYEDFR